MRIEIFTGGRQKGVVVWGEGVPESVEDPIEGRSWGKLGNGLRLNSNQTRDNRKKKHSISASIFPNTVGQQTLVDSKRRGKSGGQHTFFLSVSFTRWMDTATQIRTCEL
jgi:hypothetical protein